MRLRSDTCAAVLVNCTSEESILGLRREVLAKALHLLASGGLKSHTAVFVTGGTSPCVAHLCIAHVDATEAMLFLVGLGADLRVSAV